MSYSDDENRPGECDWCHDDRGMCDRFIELDEDRRFSIKLEETFDVETVRNDDNSFFVIKHDFNYFNVYFSSFPIRLAYPMLCKTLCPGEDGFWRPWKYGNQKNLLRNHHGVDFKVKLYNAESVTHFGCKNWEALCKMYGFDEGMVVTMDLGDPTIAQERPSIFVLVDTPPILPPCELNIVIK